jgi:hypothetical protein
MVGGRSTPVRTEFLKDQNVPPAIEHLVVSTRGQPDRPDLPQRQVAGDLLRYPSAACRTAWLNTMSGPGIATPNWFTYILSGKEYIHDGRSSRPRPSLIRDPLPAISGE